MQNALVLRLSQFGFVKKAKAVGQSLFGKHLLVTNLAISASLSASGDLIQQKYEMLKTKTIELDKLRTRNMTIGGISVGFVCHHLYNFLDKKLPGRTAKIVFKKVVIDQ